MKTFKIIKFIAVPAILLSLQSCFVAKDYERPEVVKQDFYRTDSFPADSLNMANLSWREMFIDSYLVSYIEEGLQNNIDIRVALQQINAAEAYMKQGKTGYFPTLSANAQAGHQEFSKNGQNQLLSSANQFQLSADLSWEADIWGKIRSQDRASRASYLQTVAAHKAVKTALIANIANTYFQLLSLDEQARVTKETIENRKKSLEVTHALKNAGTVTEVNVQQTEAQLYRAQAVLLDLENNIHLLENTLSILVGSAPQQFKRGRLAQQDIPADLEIGVPAQLLRNRPDVMTAEFNLINAFEMTNVARSSFYPSLRLTASGGLQSLEFKDFFNANSLFASVVGSLAQPIFNHRQIKTQYEVAEAQQQIAFLDFRGAILNASREVSDALYNYETAVDKIEVNTKEFEAYDLATTYSEELLNNGYANYNYLEVITARANALNSRLNLINEKFNKLSAIVDLYQALGGGWK